MDEIMAYLGAYAIPDSIISLDGPNSESIKLHNYSYLNVPTIISKAALGNAAKGQITEHKKSFVCFMGGEFNVRLRYR